MLYDLFRFGVKLWSGDTELREMTTKSNVRPILIINGSVLLRFSKSTHRSSRSTHPLDIKKKSQWILAYERGQQERTFDLLLQLLVQLCFGLRRENSENCAKAIPIKLRSGDTRLRERKTKTSLRPPLTMKLRSGDTRLRERKTKTGLRPPLTVISLVVFWTSTRELRKLCEGHSYEIAKWGYSAAIKLRSGDTRLRERKIKRSLRPPLTVISLVVFWTSTRELGKFRGGHSCKLNCEVGILGCGRGKQRRAFDRLLQLLIKLRSGDTRLRERKTKTSLRPPLTVISLVVFWTSTRELGKFRGGHSCKLNCEVGILGCGRGKQRRAFDGLLHLLMKLRSGDTRLRERTTKTGLRPTLTVTSSVMKLRSGDTRLRERKTKTGLRPPLTVISLVVFWTSTREFGKFRGGHSCKLNCEVGILGCGRGKQRRTFDGLLHLLIKLRSGDTRLQERKTKTSLRRTFTLTSLVLFWTSTRELGKFRGGHSCNVYLILDEIAKWGYSAARENNKDGPSTDSYNEIAKWGYSAAGEENKDGPSTASYNEIAKWGYSTAGEENKDGPSTASYNEIAKWGYSAAREQQRRAFDRLLQLLVQLCFGLRRENSENCAKAIPRLFDFRLNYEVGIHGWERGQQRQALQRLLQLQVQLCCGLQRVNLDIFAGCLSSEYSRRVDANFVFAFSGDFDNLSPRMDFEIFALPEDFENLSRRKDLEIFALPVDFENLSPRRDLEIFAFPVDFDNLSPRVDLEIFAPLRDFENLSPRVDLEIFAPLGGLKIYLHEGT
ncbi:hypothetical protein V1477_014130 [Vespula maculifrons]|uniref:Uncharacterized protein n=1 Tax=Vespula maculifrons TaxID=7453 RepID=A0ABD2BK61_VESMC